MAKTLSNYFTQELEKARLEHRFRALKDSEHLNSTIVSRDNKNLISFSSNDYLGFSNNKKLATAGISALKKYGSGAGASRLITGNNTLYNQLETNLCKLSEAEESVVFSSGYTTNLGIISAIFEKGDLVIIDKLSHSCIIEGAFLSSAQVKRFNHNNYKHLEDILEKERRNNKKCGIITESVFSMDGDKVDLQTIFKIAKKYDCFVIADFAHDIEFYEWKNYSKNQSFIKIGTLSKAFAGLGGYASGISGLKDFTVNKCKPFIFSTALPPSVLATNNEAVKLALADKNIGKKAIQNANYFYEIVKKHPDIQIKKPESQIIPIIIGDSEKSVKLSKKLEDSGILAHAIRPPTVPKNTSRLRLSFSVAHDYKQIENLAEIITKWI